MQRLGVISDIHGNCVALDAVLADVETHPVDSWICLGDALQGGPQPREVVERLQQLACPVVLGNADAFLLDPRVGEQEAAGTEREQQLRLVRDWTVGALGEEALEFVRTFVPALEIDLGDAGGLLCFHGGPDDYNTIVAPNTSPDALRALLGPRGARTMCGGHIHRQWTVSLDDWTFFNPGSVGLAYNYYLPPERFHFTPHAEFAILHVNEASVGVEFLQVPFDVAALDRAVEANGHPEAGLAQRYRPPA
jgi:predicted phosphodiesterase